jgi:hypothetical protein
MPNPSGFLVLRLSATGIVASSTLTKRRYCGGRVKIVAGLLLVVWTAGGAFAAGASKIPEIDVEAECTSASKGDPVGQQACIDLEKRGYYRLKEVWLSTPEDIREACLLSKRYIVISECIDKAATARGASD